jgi:RNA polymerase sigma-70 factor (ECF subfamily)
VAAITPDLLARAIAGERRAVHELLCAITPIIQARIARVLLRRGAARSHDVRQEVLDLTQQVYVTLFDNSSRMLRAWDPARGMSLENYVGLIAEQQAIARHRGQEARLWHDLSLEGDDLDRSADSSRTPERIAASRELLGAIHERVRAKLTERGAELFHMLYIEGRSLDEVCSEMEMSANAVYAWRSRMGRLVEQIAGEILSEPHGAVVEPSGERR